MASFPVFDLGQIVYRVGQTKGQMLQNQMTELKMAGEKSAQERAKNLAELRPQAMQGNQSALNAIAAVDPAAAKEIVDLQSSQQKMQGAGQEALMQEFGKMQVLGENLLQVPVERRNQVLAQAVQVFREGSPIRQNLQEFAASGQPITDEVIQQELQGIGQLFQEAEQFSQSPTQGVDAEGNPVFFQAGERGGIRQLEGVTPATDDEDAFERDVQAIMAANPGLTRADAVNIKLRVVRGEPDPRGGMTSINMADVVRGTAPGGQNAPQQQTPEQLSQQLSQRREELFGGQGRRQLEEATGPLQQGAQRAGNLLSGLVGAEPLFPDVEASSRALDIVRRDMARQTAIDGGNRLLVTIYRDALKDMPSATDTDAGARQKFREVLRRLDDEAVKIEEILQSDRAPSDQISTAIEARADLNLQRRRLIELVQGEPASGEKPQQTEVEGMQSTPSGTRFRVIQ